MNILYLLGSLHRGGAETLVLNVLKSAQKTGLNFYCTYRYKNGAFEKDFYESGAKLCYLPYINIYIFSYLFKLRKFIFENKIKIVHAHQPIDAFYALLACIGLKVSVVQTLHGYDFETNGIAMLALKFSLKHVKMNFFVSETQMKYYAENYKYNSVCQKVLYNGIDFKKFSISNDNFVFNGIRNELSLPDNKLLLVSVGNFTEVRDQLLLCKFINLLKIQFTDFHFVFVGSKQERFPKYYDECINYCTKNNLYDFVTFIQNRNDVPEILAESDVFVYATKYDTFGIAVVEAMAAGLPVIVNDWDVINEITDHGKYSILYKSGEENDLLQKFMLFLQNQKQFKQSSEYVSEYVRTKFAIENHIENLLKEYLRLISK